MLSAKVKGPVKEGSNGSNSSIEDPMPQLQHYKDWPNVAGFETTDEIKTPVELNVEGTIPAYAAGVLYRTGPSHHKIETAAGKSLSMSHWFDGFSQVHRFAITPAAGDGVRVSYNSRRTTDALIEHMRKTGSIDYTFGQKRDPCESFFKKVMSTFMPASVPENVSNDPNYGNVGVTLSINLPRIEARAGHGTASSGIRSLTAKTDVNRYKFLDPETLEPIGFATQTVLHPDLTGLGSASHSKSCPLTGDVFNYNLAFGKKPTYRIFQVSAATQKTTILATITEAPAAYIHSLFLTPTKVILCVWGSRYTFGGLSMVYHRNVLDSIAPMDPTKPCLWYVVDRTPAARGVVATYESDPFFCFHSINAFEVPSTRDAAQTDIIADLVAYSDVSILKRFYYENLTSTSAGAATFADASSGHARPYLCRFRLANVPLEPSQALQRATQDFAMPCLESVELPVINPARVTLQHRFVYGVTDSGQSSFFDGLCKFDADTKRNTRWQVQGHSPSEPIFVARPGGEAEDEGVLLSVVLDGRKGQSYLLCLDAASMTELGRAWVPAVVGFGFHGVHVLPEGKGRALDY